MRRTMSPFSLPFALALLTLLAGCNHDRDSRFDPPMPNLPAVPTAPSAIDPAALAAPNWDVVLAAGSRALGVADDAVIEINARLAAIGVPLERLHEFSADPDINNSATSPRRSRKQQERDDAEITDDRAMSRDLPRGTLPARPSLMLRQIMSLDGRRNGACLAYFASVPEDDGIKMLEGTLSPDQLDRALGASCGDAPTVVVVSGCDTGRFAAAPMTRPNRLIITAAASGRSGFGCGPNVGFTTFDECFQGALDGAPNWATIFEQTRRCVVHRGELVKQEPVDPQIYLGSLVAGLKAPWANRPAVVRQVEFNQGIGRFTMEGVPFFSALKTLTHPTVEAYHHAAAPKAMALTYAGTVAFAAATVGETMEDVARLALQRCEFRSGGACVLYARNEALAASGASGQPSVHPSMLVRGGSVDPATTPFIRDTQRPRIAAYLRQAGPKALALGPDTEAIGIGATPEAALTACTKSGGPCVLFAEDNHIVLVRP
jgi:hypothetical protein